MQFQMLPVEERFSVRLTDETISGYPAGAFSNQSSYPVYAIRLREHGDNVLTEFFLPASDAAFYWVDATGTRVARRA